MIDWVLGSKKQIQDYGTKLFILVIYAFMYSVALNIFWRNGNIYAGGITGISQIITTVLENITGQPIPIAIVYYVLNIPLFLLGWFVVDRKFVLFTVIGVTFASFAIEIMPVIQLTNDPIICAVFGGAISGYSLGLALKNGLSTGGMDIVLLSLRKLTGKSVGRISMIINGIIVLTAGFIFGWPHAFYSLLSIFVGAKATDLVYVKHKKVQVMIITQKPELVIEKLQEKLSRGITVIYHAKGAYQQKDQAILITVITRYEMEILKEIMKVIDPSAFVSVSQDVEILSDFKELEII
ncbi:YitT family protein [Enterococcus rivorum]|uniref:DUF2179 domain-containing protein n=1 Tax=Enterococcus rivorum TaxID=762845 RepID=A0A1E5KXS7_9ENTE|nr:YitT family protein [Enterococcus rivorum]MBP2099760.1 uncharacterized membrane-anchored protein YitT (DUF2179 family) [Enterococcus rivorum]OEH82655.1 hypothetical protein BCR26_12560 [Enterococcus rivorum]